MINPDIEKYVREARGSGFADGDIKQTLLGAGWKPEEVDAVFVQPTPMAPQPQAMMAATAPTAGTAAVAQGGTMVIAAGY
jgi:hypothetical protein